MKVSFVEAYISFPFSKRHMVCVLCQSVPMVCGEYLWSYNSHFAYYTCRFYHGRLVSCSHTSITSPSLPVVVKSWFLLLKVARCLTMFSTTRWVAATDTVQCATCDITTLYDWSRKLTLGWKQIWLSLLVFALWQQGRSYGLDSGQVKTQDT